MTTWVFDVDACLIDSLSGTSLRPGAHDLLEHLHRTGAEVLVWSAGGAAYARSRLAEFGVDHLVDAFISKDERGGDGRYLWTDGVAPGTTMVFVEDRPEDVPSGAEVIAVSPYIAHNPHDRGLDGVATRAGLVDRSPK
ncbi:MAG TPA: HAD family hydrolase [Microthrixaceae bacterium]|nr:HAD family hydrolase [Microthrixaceae bacterium]